MVTLDNAPFYGISLRFFHESIDPDEITALLKIVPNHAWKAGEQAKTPIETPLNFKRKQSYWCYCVNKGDRFFSVGINEIISCLTPHRQFLHQIVAERGRIEINLNLPGSINIGDTIPLEIFSKLIDLKIEIGIEVFPHMKNI